MPFFANATEQADLVDVPDEWFKQFDINLKILKSDSIINKGLLVTNVQNAHNLDNLKNIKQALQNPEELVVDYKGFGGVFGDQVFNVVQGTSNTQNIISKLNYLERLIKKFGFVRTDTQDMGTKNTISTEIENLNSDADDYLEMKANLLEES